MQDLVANQIQIMVDQSSNSLPQVRAGKIKAYAVTAKARSAAAPEIPTAAEAGYPDGSVDLARPVGAQGHAGRGDRQAQCRSGGNHAGSRDRASAWRISARTFRRRPRWRRPPSPTSRRREYARWKTILEAANVKIE